MYYDIKYQKGLQTYYQRMKQLNDESDVFEKYIELYSKLQPTEPFSKYALLNVTGLARDGSVTAKLLNEYVSMVSMDSKVTSSMLKQLMSSVWYMSTIRDVSNDFIISVIMYLNDSQRKVHGEYIYIPLIPYLNNTVSTGYSTAHYSTVDIKPKKISPFSVRIGAYDGNVERGGIQGVVDGTGMTVVSEYSMTGQNVVIDVTPEEKANLMILEFNDDIEHFVTVNGETEVTSGVCVLKDLFEEPFSINIKTLDYKRTGEKKYITSIKKLSMYKADVYDSILGIHSTSEVKPLKLDISKKGIYPGDGSVLVDVKADSLQRLGSVTMGGVHSRPITLSKNSKEFVIKQMANFVSVDELTDPVDYSKVAIYGKYDETAGYQTGYKLINGYKWSFAYLTTVPEGVDGVYNLFGEEVEEITDYNVYLVKWSETKPAVDLYSHIAPSNSIAQKGISISHQIKQDIGFAVHEVNDFVPSDDYELSIQKPVLYATKLVGEYENTDSGFSFNLDTSVKQGFINARDFTAVVVIKDENGYEVLGPDKVNVGEPIVEDPNDSVYPTVSVIYEGDLDGKTINAYVYNITDVNSQTIDQEGLTVNITLDKYQSGLKIIPVSETPKQITTYIDGTEFSEKFNSPMVGSHTITIKSQESFVCDALLIIPFEPTTLITSSINYIPGYIIDGLNDNSETVDESLFIYKQDGSEVATIIEGTFYIEISGTVTSDCELVFNRGSDDEGLMVYSTGGHAIDSLRLELKAVSEGYQPVVTVPRLKYTLRW